MTKAAPIPILGARYQPAFYRIPVNVTKLLHKLALTPEIEIVVAGLPERISGS